MKYFDPILFAMFYFIDLWSLKSIWAILRELLIFLFLVYKLSKGQTLATRKSGKSLENHSKNSTYSQINPENP